jgi:hypothetical protein
VRDCGKGVVSVDVDDVDDVDDDEEQGIGNAIATEDPKRVATPWWSGARKLPRPVDDQQRKAEGFHSDSRT